MKEVRSPVSKCQATSDLKNSSFTSRIFFRKASPEAKVMSDLPTNEWLLQIPRGAALTLVIVLCSITVFAQQAEPFESAMALFREKHFTAAAKAFASIPESHPKSPDAQLYLAKSLINTGRFAEAEAVLRRYTAAAPASHDGFYLFAYILFRQGRAKESLGIYQSAANLKAPAPDDLKIIGLNYALLEDYGRSADYLERSHVADPANTETLYYLGRARYMQNRFAEASSAFQEVLRRDPRHVKAQNNLGQVFEARNDVDEAVAAYRRAVEIDLNSSKPSELPLLNLASLLIEKNEIEEALALLTRAATVNPASAKVRFQLGKTYLRLGRLTDAERELLQATRLDPKDIGAYYQLGRLYHRLGKKELARQTLATSEQLRSNRQ